MGRGLQSVPFRIFGGLSFFEKADADEDKKRRIAGVISTEALDHQGEIILQNGLDFSYFLQEGWFNDNHEKGIAGAVGYPESVSLYKAGEQLPDGSKAKRNCTWAEGYLLKGKPRADDIWLTALALRNTPRKLGFSVEGKVQQRLGQTGKIIAKADVLHCAVTHVPVNAETKLNAFAKSFVALNNSTPDCLEEAWTAFHKALTMGEPSVELPDEPQTGEGARRRCKRKLSKQEAIAVVKSYFPGISNNAADRIIDSIARGLI
jgi:hypothetical protein